MKKRFKLYDNSYKFKNVDDFIKDFGRDWKLLVLGGYIECMSVLLNKRIKCLGLSHIVKLDEKYVGFCIKSKTLGIIFISYQMIKPCKRLFSKKFKKYRLCLSE